MPYHRKTGERMLDSILVVNGETRKKFRFTIAVDQVYPMQAALDAMTPITVIPTTQGPPKSGSTGWFFHLNVRNVQNVQILELMENPGEVADGWGTNGNQAQDALRKAGTLNPDNADTPLGLAEAAAHENNFDEANQLVEEAAKIDKDNSNLPYVRGVIKAGQKDFKAAVKDLEDAVSKDDRNAYAHYYAGLSYNALKRPDKMIDHFQKFMKLASKAPEAGRVQSILRTAR